MRTRNIYQSRKNNGPRTSEILAKHIERYSIKMELRAKRRNEKNEKRWRSA